MDRNRTVDLWVGLFTLAGMAALMFLAFRAANATTAFYSQSVYHLTAHFNNIGGLKVRAAVRSAGVSIGRVTNITFDPQNFEAVVGFTINSKYPFPKDSSAQILTSGLLGDQYLMINPGGDPTNLKDGDTLQITQGAVVLENLIGQFLYSKAAEGNTEKPASPATEKPGPGGAQAIPGGPDNPAPGMGKAPGGTGHK